MSDGQGSFHEGVAVVVVQRALSDCNRIFTDFAALVSGGCQFSGTGDGNHSVGGILDRVGQFRILGIVRTSLIIGNDYGRSLSDGQGSFHEGIAIVSVERALSDCNRVFTDRAFQSSRSTQLRNSRNLNGGTFGIGDRIGQFRILGFVETRFILGGHRSGNLSDGQSSFHEGIAIVVVERALSDCNRVFTDRAFQSSRSTQLRNSRNLNGGTFGIGNRIGQFRIIAMIRTILVFCGDRGRSLSDGQSPVDKSIAVVDGIE